MPARRGEPPWLGYEYVRGWGVFALPFNSGHVLALRVFPENDFSPYLKRIRALCASLVPVVGQQ